VLEEAVAERALAVVDVRDDAEVAVAVERDGGDAFLDGGAAGVERGAGFAARANVPGLLVP
jgi:hypothetical protein